MPQMFDQEESNLKQLKTRALAAHSPLINLLLSIEGYIECIGYDVIKKDNISTLICEIECGTVAEVPLTFVINFNATNTQDILISTSDVIIKFEIPITQKSKDIIRMYKLSLI